MCGGAGDGDYLECFRISFYILEKFLCFGGFVASSRWRDAGFGRKEAFKHHISIYIHILTVIYEIYILFSYFALLVRERSLIEFDD